MIKTDYDLLIVGGGMVGASLAGALGNKPLRIGIIEAVPFRSDRQPSYDDRSIALSYGSRRIFQGIGAWQAIAASATPIKKIHISDQGHFGATHLDNVEEGVEALGYVVTSRQIGQVLTDHINTFENIELICPAQLVDINIQPEQAQVVIQQNGASAAISARLVVAADGIDSIARKKLQIKTTQWDYGQTAVIANVTPQYSHQNTAYERFTKNGPLALLPLGENRCAVVWTRSNEDVEATMALDDESFLVQLQEQFGYRLGEFHKTGLRQAYPLRMVRAQEQVLPRLALIGNAAHALHPIAGQGFNLGLRDVAVLAETLNETLQQNQDIGDFSVLSHYAQWRKRDHLRVISFTDSLVRLFSNTYFPLTVGRNLGLLAADIFPAVKHGIARQAMGMAGRLPKLARGLPL